MVITNGKEAKNKKKIMKGFVKEEGVGRKRSVKMTTIDIRI